MSNPPTGSGMDTNDGMTSTEAVAFAVVTVMQGGKILDEFLDLCIKALTHSMFDRTISSDELHNRAQAVIALTTMQRDRLEMVREVRSQAADLEVTKPLTPPEEDSK